MDTNSRDEELWKVAKKRASFQHSLVLYLVINAFLWVIWWFTADTKNFHEHIPWPAWAMVGWGFGLVFQYFAAYGGTKENLANKEYEKLKREKERV
jgi:uncharacterized ion transporter superfamily protein YfcC